MCGFSPPERELCRRIFLRLTQPGEGTEDTKRRASLRELAPAGTDLEAVRAVIERLAGDTDPDVAHIGEVGQCLPSGDVVLAEDHLPVGAMFGAPGANPAFQTAAQPIPVMIGMPPLQNSRSGIGESNGIHLPGLKSSDSCGIRSDTDDADLPGVDTCPLQPVIDLQMKH